MVKNGNKEGGFAFGKLVWFIAGPSVCPVIAGQGEFASFQAHCMLLGSTKEPLNCPNYNVKPLIQRLHFRLMER